MDEALRAELLEMERVDRAVRADLVARGELHRPGYHPQMEAVHRRHNARMRAIINAHGWPGFSLVGADGCRAAFQRHLDLEVLCEALGRLLRHEWEDGYLIYQLVVENMDPAAVAAERGTSPRMLTELLRDAVGALAVEYEDVAHMSLDPRRTPGVRPAPARKRR
jgi:hypothetical protein